MRKLSLSVRVAQLVRVRLKISNIHNSHVQVSDTSLHSFGPDEAFVGRGLNGHQEPR